jgi:hypothetical protein
MLSLQVRTCLSDIMSVLHTKSELKILARKKNINAAMYSKVKDQRERHQLTIRLHIKNVYFHFVTDTKASVGLGVSSQLQ